MFFTFYQGFIFSILAKHGALKATTYWTSANIANGLQALCTCCEMVIFSIWMFFAFSAKPYIEQGRGLPKTSFFRSFGHALNPSDFFIEMWLAIKFTIDYIRGKPGTHSRDEKRAYDIEGAFNQAYREEDGVPMISVDHADKGDAPQHHPLEQEHSGQSIDYPARPPPV